MLLEGLRTWQALKQNLPVKTGEKGVVCVSLKVQKASFVTIFSLTFLWLPVYLKKPFLSFQFHLQLSFGFPSCLASPSSLPLLCTFVFEISQEFLSHLCWPSVIPAVISACQKGQIFYFKKAVFEDKAVPLGSFRQPGQNFPCEMLQRHYLNEPKYIDLKVQDSVFYTFLRILNATILCLLQPRHSHSPPILPC